VTQEIGVDLVEMDWDSVVLMPEVCRKLKRINWKAIPLAILMYKHIKQQVQINCCPDF